MMDLGRSDRAAKPRTVGLTHVIDTGQPVESIRGHLEMAADYVDIWKFGFGTSYLDPTVAKKVELLAVHGIESCVGGTMLEAAWVEGKQWQCLDWASDMGFTMVEVSNGAAGMDVAEKRRLIQMSIVSFTVAAEVGSKDAGAQVDPDQWASEMAGDLAAGATWAIAEGREGGNVGLYSSSGSLRWDLVAAIEAVIGVERVIFEAPRTGQQTALIQRFGPNVNLGNIQPGGLLSLEALRRGLRGDTLRSRTGNEES